MLRIISFVVLLVSLLCIAVITDYHVDPPITDPVVVGFIKSDYYLPKGDTVSRVDLYAAISKLLADDRRAYRGISILSGVALASAFGLFVSGRRARDA
jgi:hypothetical protein